MDLSTISSKFLNREYKTMWDIDKDFKKMVDNCKLYHGQHSGKLSNLIF